MKVMHINAYYGYGSTGNIVKDLCTVGHENGIDTYAIYWLARNKKYESEKVRFCGYTKDKNKIAKILNWIIFGGKIVYNTQITKRILNSISDIEPDIIHLHNLHGDFEYGSIDLPLFIKELTIINKKVIWTFHDCWPITGRCYHFAYTNCDKWKFGCGSCPQRFYDREGIFMDNSHNNWETKNNLYSAIKDLTIVTVSKWLEGVVKQSMLKNKKVITIYNGLEYKIFSSAQSKIKDEFINKQSKFRILCIGWDRKKGYKDYYKLSQLLSNDEEIVVVGKRPLLRKIRKLPDNITILPRVDNPSKMSNIYKNADVYFNASQAETFGLTTAEALACGIPVVGYDSTATPEIIGENGKCGYSVPKGDIVQIYEAIKKIKLNKMLKNKKNIMISNCTNRARILFDRKDMLLNYIKLYQNLL